MSRRCARYNRTRITVEYASAARTKGINHSRPSPPPSTFPARPPSRRGYFGVRGVQTSVSIIKRARARLAAPHDDRQQTGPRVLRSLYIACPLKTLRTHKNPDPKVCGPYIHTMPVRSPGSVPDTCSRPPESVPQLIFLYIFSPNTKYSVLS